MDKKCIAAGLSLALTVTLAPTANAQMGATRKKPKAAKPKPNAAPAICKARVGQTAQTEDFATVFSTLAASKSGGAVKSKYETQAQYEARVRAMPRSSHVIAAPFLAQYEAEEQRFILRYRDFTGLSQVNGGLMERRPYPYAPLDKYVITDLQKVGSTQGLGNRSFNRLTMRSQTDYDMFVINTGRGIPNHRGQIRSANSRALFTPESYLKPGRGGSEEKYGISDRSDYGMREKMRWYLNMSGSEAQANDRAMKWAYEITTNGPAFVERHSPAPGAVDAQFYNVAHISADVQCALILDRNNVVKKAIVARP